MFESLKELKNRFLKLLGVKHNDSLTTERVVPNPTGGYVLAFVGNHEPHAFKALDDDEALKEMCLHMRIQHPPNVVQFKSCGGSALYRVHPATKIFPMEPVRASRAGIARSYPEEHRPQIPKPQMPQPQ